MIRLILGCGSLSRTRRDRPLKQDGKQFLREGWVWRQIDTDDPPTTLPKFIEAPHQEIGWFVLALEGLLRRERRACMSVIGTSRARAWRALYLAGSDRHH
jgi:hypothetical protein